MSDMVPMTRTGYEKLRAELDDMESVQMPAISNRVAAARSEGDLSENAEYHGARESQGLLQAHQRAPRQTGPGRAHRHL